VADVGSAGYAENQWAWLSVHDQGRFAEAVSQLRRVL
jgi:hypothetical protein